MLYISVMNHMSVDCVSNPAKPDMHDIGILASLDPVALDQACIDLVYTAPDSHSLRERIEMRNGTLILSHAEKIGFPLSTHKLHRHPIGAIHPYFVVTECAVGLADFTLNNRFTFFSDHCP